MKEEEGREREYGDKGRTRVRGERREGGRKEGEREYGATAEERLYVCSLCKGG